MPLLTLIRRKIAMLANRLRRRNGLSFADQCIAVIMRVCSLQLERQEVRELAPVKGAVGAILLSGGAITTLSYQVFDKDADKVDKAIRLEPWRAFAQVTMRIQIESDPEFTVVVDQVEVKPRDCHKAPGIQLIKQLSQYFPLLPRPHTGPTIKPFIETIQ